MLINNELLDALTQRAKESPRLRMHYDLRDSEQDGSMRMLNALEPGTVVPIHRHNETSEEIVVLRGRVEVSLYDAEGNEVAFYRLEPGTDSMACHVPLAAYHSSRSLCSGTVIIEFKNGMYDPETTEDFL